MGTQSKLFVLIQNKYQTKIHTDEKKNTPFPFDRFSI
jgi:hypothetical protein